MGFEMVPPAMRNAVPLSNRIDSLVFGYLQRMGYTHALAGLASDSAFLADENRRVKCGDQIVISVNDRVHDKTLEDIVQTFIADGRFEVPREMLEFGEELRRLTNKYTSLTSHSSILISENQQRFYGQTSYAKTPMRSQHNGYTLSNFNQMHNEHRQQSNFRPHVLNFNALQEMSKSNDTNCSAQSSMMPNGHNGPMTNQQNMNIHQGVDSNQMTMMPTGANFQTPKSLPIDQNQAEGSARRKPQVPHNYNQVMRDTVVGPLMNIINDNRDTRSTNSQFFNAFNYNENWDPVLQGLEGIDPQFLETMDYPPEEMMDMSCKDADGTADSVANLNFATIFDTQPMQENTLMSAQNSAPVQQQPMDQSNLITNPQYQTTSILQISSASSVITDVSENRMMDVTENCSNQISQNVPVAATNDKEMEEGQLATAESNSGDLVPQSMDRNFSLTASKIVEKLSKGPESLITPPRRIEIPEKKVSTRGDKQIKGREGSEGKSSETARNETLDKSASVKEREKSNDRRKVNGGKTSDTKIEYKTNRNSRDSRQRSPDRYRRSVTPKHDDKRRYDHSDRRRNDNNGDRKNKKREDESYHRRDVDKKRDNDQKRKDDVDKKSEHDSSTMNKEKAKPDYKTKILGMSKPEPLLPEKAVEQESKTSSKTFGFNKPEPVMPEKPLDPGQAKKIDFQKRVDKRKLRLSPSNGSDPLSKIGLEIDSMDKQKRPTNDVVEQCIQRKAMNSITMRIPKKSSSQSSSSLDVNKPTLKQPFSTGSGPLVPAVVVETPVVTQNVKEHVEEQTHQVCQGADRNMTTQFINPVPSIPRLGTILIRAGGLFHEHKENKDNKVLSDGELDSSTSPQPVAVNRHPKTAIRYAPSKPMTEPRAPFEGDLSGLLGSPRKDSDSSMSSLNESPSKSVSSSSTGAAKRRKLDDSTILSVVDGIHGHESSPEQSF